MRLRYLTILLLRQKRWLMVRINSEEFPSMKLKYLYPHCQPPSRSLESKHFGCQYVFFVYIKYGGIGKQSDSSRKDGNLISASSLS
jgi:hypothetical protein